VRVRIRALLPRLHVLPALTIVVDIGGAALTEALERAGADGDVVVVNESPDALADLRAGCSAANVLFLLGDGDVLPLPDASVDVVLGADGGADAARVKRP
jgi:ubiquinone/menaquinone biosynthesis C-methylase UbiE